MTKPSTRSIPVSTAATLTICGSRRRKTLSFSLRGALSFQLGAREKLRREDAFADDCADDIQLTIKRHPDCAMPFTQRRTLQVGYPT